LTKVILTDYITATTAAWILAVLFAFITNKFYVFQSKKTSIPVLSKELISFLFSRILSLGLDIFSMILLVGLLMVNDLVSKIFANILVVIFNYVLGKFFVFKRLSGSSDDQI